MQITDEKVTISFLINLLFKINIKKLSKIELKYKINYSESRDMKVPPIIINSILSQACPSFLS